MNNLKYYREKAGLTQNELEKKSGVRQEEISRVEMGVKDLKGLAWASIARALGCSIDELLGK